MAQSAYEASIQHSLRELTIGNGVGGNQLRGALDELRIWSRALSQEEIAAGMSTRLEGPAEDLVLSLGFDGIPSRTLVDRAETGLVATLPGGPATETRLFRFDGAAGDSLVFGASGSNNIVYRLIGPSGQVLEGPSSLGVRDPLVLIEDGSYILAIEGRVTDNHPRDFSFVIAPKTRAELGLTVGETIEGTLEAVGAAHAYAFTLDEATTLLFDSLSTDRSDITWSLIGPRGIEVSGRGFNNTNAVPTVQVPAGAYTLVVDGVGTATGDYAFRMIDLATAPLVAFGDMIDVTLSPGSASAIFAFDAARGDQIALPIVSGDPRGRLIDPFGRVVYGNAWLSNLGELTLPATGRYTLLVEGTGWGTQSEDVAYGFRIDKVGFEEPPVLEGLPLAIGATVEGETLAPNEPNYYLFTLTEPARLYFDALAATASFTGWTLTGPRGDEILGRDFFASDAVHRDGDVAIDLIAGTYRLSVTTELRWWGSGSGSYAFRLLDLANAEPLARDAVVEAVLEPSRATRVYAFEGSAGDRIVLDTLSATSGGSSLTYRVIDPWGREIRRLENVLDAQPLTLAHDGTYTLLIEGSLWNGGTSSTVEFALRDVVEVVEPLTIGETVTGQVPGPRGAAIYSFSLEEETTLFLDNLLDVWQASLTITGPAGFEREVRLDDWHPPLMLLGPGDYEVRVTGRDNMRPDFAFRFLDAAAATAITLDEAVSGQLPTGRETSLYRIDVPAGQRYSLGDVTTSTSWWLDPRFRLIDPFGRVTLGPWQLANQSVQTFEFEGTWLLMIEGRLDAGSSVSYGFTLQDPLDPPLRSAEIAERIVGEIDRPGQVHRLEIEVSEQTLLYLDSLTNDSSMRVRIEGPAGVDRQYSLRSADGRDFTGNPAIAAAPGTYSITVWRTSGTGSFDFAVRDC